MLFWSRSRVVIFKVRFFSVSNGPGSVQCSLLVLADWRLDAPVSSGPAPHAALSRWTLSSLTESNPVSPQSSGQPGTQGDPRVHFWRSFSEKLPHMRALPWNSSHLGLQHPFPNSCLLFIEFCFFPCMLPSHPGAPTVEI